MNIILQNFKFQQGKPQNIHKLSPPTKVSQIVTQKNAGFSFVFIGFIDHEHVHSTNLAITKQLNVLNVSRHACPESLVHSTLYIASFAF